MLNVFILEDDFFSSRAWKRLLCWHQALSLKN